MQKLTEHDLNLFRFIASTGCCTIQQARQVYSPVSNSQWYHYKRIQRLAENGYLLKHGSYLELTKWSAEIIGETKYRFRHETVRDMQIEIAEIVLSTQLEFISSRQIRNEFNLNRKTLFKGVFNYQDTYYFLYLLAENPNKQYLGRIYSELRMLAPAGIIRHAVVFSPTPTAMAMFGTDPCQQHEIFLLPYPSGVKLFSNYFSPEIQDYIISLAPGAVRSKYPFATFETPSEFFTVLILNDLSKRNALSGYFVSPFPKPVTIICLESQQELFKNQYPRARIISIPDSKITLQN